LLQKVVQKSLKALHNVWHTDNDKWTGVLLYTIYLEVIPIQSESPQLWLLHLR